MTARTGAFSTSRLLQLLFASRRKERARAPLVHSFPAPFDRIVWDGVTEQLGASRKSPHLRPRGSYGHPARPRTLNFTVPSCSTRPLPKLMDHVGWNDADPLPRFRWAAALGPHALAASYPDAPLTPPFVSTPTPDGPAPKHFGDARRRRPKPRANGWVCRLPKCKRWFLGAIGVRPMPSV